MVMGECAITPSWLHSALYGLHSHWHSQYPCWSLTTNERLFFCKLSLAFHPKVTRLCCPLDLMPHIVPSVSTLFYHLWLLFITGPSGQLLLVRIRCFITIFQCYLYAYLFILNGTLNPPLHAVCRENVSAGGVVLLCCFDHSVPQ